jgi:hypothetical protein
MITAQTPFRGTPAEVMYQHQHAPLPLEQLINVPQPIAVLLQVFLEKDPQWRFQNPTEVACALSKVNDAFKARRSITHQSFREIPDQQLGTSGKSVEFLTNLRNAFAARRIRLVLWAALAVGGGAILVLSFSFGPKSFTPRASRSLSPEITAPEKSIAVLPFESLSDNKSNTYFADVGPHVV